MRRVAPRVELRYNLKGSVIRKVFKVFELLNEGASWKYFLRYKRLMLFIDDLLRVFDIEY